MSASTVKSNVVNVGFDSSQTLTLDEYIKANKVIPISLFGITDTAEAIRTAITYLTEKGEGSVEVPASADYSTLTVRFRRDKVGNPVVNYILSSHCYPLNYSRPYTSDEWQVGDTILNTDITTNPCFGWICTESGAVGKWEQFGNIKKWNTQIEELNYLPDPSELQKGRQVLLYNENSTSNGLYFCAKVGEEYKWVQQNMAMGTEEARPTNPDANWWYYNTTIGFPQWFDSRIENPDGTFGNWRTIYDLATYESMLAEYQRSLDTYVQGKISDAMDTEVREIETALQNTYDQKYNAWLDLVNNNYSAMIEAPVDNYLNNHPILTEQKIKMVEVNEQRSEVDTNGNRTYRAYVVENGQILNISSLPDTFLLSFLVDADSDYSKDCYFRLFNATFKMVNSVGDSRLDIRAGVWVTLAIHKGAETCTLLSYGTNIDSEKLDIAGETGTVITTTATASTDNNIRISEIYGRTRDFKDNLSIIPSSGKLLHGVNQILNVEKLYGHTLVTATDENEAIIPNHTPSVDAPNTLTRFAENGMLNIDLKALAQEGTSYGAFISDAYALASIPCDVEKANYVGKNLLDCSSIVTQRLSNVDITVGYNDQNEITGITLNGTASENISLKIPCGYLKAGHYILTGSPTTGCSEFSTYSQVQYADGEFAKDLGSGIAFTVPADTAPETLYFEILVRGSQTVTELTYRPMIRRKEVLDAEYEPYRGCLADYLVSTEDGYIGYRLIGLHNVVSVTGFVANTSYTVSLADAINSAYDVICSHYAKEDISIVNETTLQITDTRFVTQEELTAWLSTNNVKILYALATRKRIESPLNLGDLFKAYYGNYRLVYGSMDDIPMKVEGTYKVQAGVTNTWDTTLTEGGDYNKELAPILADGELCSAVSSPKAFKVKLEGGGYNGVVNVVSGATLYFNASETLVVGLFKNDGTELGTVKVTNELYIPEDCTYITLATETTKNLTVIISTEVGYADTDVVENLPSVINFSGMLDLYNIDGTQDKLYYENGAYKIQRHIQHMVLSGDESGWALSEEYPNTFVLPITALTGYKANSHVLISNFKEVESLAELKLAYNSYFVNDTGIYLHYKDEIPSIQDFLDMMRFSVLVRPTKVLYILETPITESVSKETQTQFKEVQGYKGYTRVSTTCNGVVPKISLGHLSSFSSSLANLAKQAMNAPKSITPARVKCVTLGDAHVYTIIDTESVFNSYIPDILLISFVLDEAFADINYLKVGSKQFRIITSNGNDVVSTMGSKGVVITLAVNMLGQTATILSTTGGDSLSCRLTIVTTCDKGNVIFANKQFSVEYVANGRTESVTCSTNSAGIAVVTLPYCASGYTVVSPVIKGYTTVPTTKVKFTGSPVDRDLVTTFEYKKDPVLSFVIDQNNSNPITSVTYADDAVGMVKNNIAWMNYYPFDRIKPVLIDKTNSANKIYLDKTDISKTVDGNPADLTSGLYNQFTEFPVIWYNFEHYADTECTQKLADGRYLKVSVAKDEVEGFARFPEDTTFNRAYIGAKKASYDATNKVIGSYSNGELPKASQNITTFRQQAWKNNEYDAVADLTKFRYTLNTHENITMLQILGILYGGSLDTQTTLGRGVNSRPWNNGVYPSDTERMGNTDSKNTGSLAHHTCTSTDNVTQMKFLWLEDIYGYFWEFVDGLVPKYDANTGEVTAWGTKLVAKMNTNATGYDLLGQLATQNGYISKMSGTNASGFLPIEVRGASNTYFSDYTWLDSTNALRVALFGGHWYRGSAVGLFCWHLPHGSGSSDVSISARLGAYGFIGSEIEETITV